VHHGGRRVPPFEELIAGTLRTAVHLEMRDAYAPADLSFIAWQSARPTTAPSVKRASRPRDHPVAFTQKVPSNWRTWTSAILILPAQEHFLIQAHRLKGLPP
jgi:hypothetical protein